MAFESESKFSLLKEISGEDPLSGEKSCDVAETKAIIKQEAAIEKPKKFVIPAKRGLAEKSVQFAEKVIVEDQDQHVKALDEPSAAKIVDLGKGEGAGEAHDSTAVKTEDGESADADKEVEDDSSEVPEAPRPKLTLGEWKAQQKQADEPHFNVRPAGEGCTKRIQHKLEKLALIQKEVIEVDLPEVKKSSSKDKKAGKSGKRDQNVKKISPDFFYQNEKKGVIRARIEQNDIEDSRRMSQNRVRTGDGSSSLKTPVDEANWRGRDEGGSLHKTPVDEANWRGREENDVALKTAVVDANWRGRDEGVSSHKTPVDEANWRGRAENDVALKTAVVDANRRGRGKSDGALKPPAEGDNWRVRGQKQQEAKDDGETADMNLKTNQV